MTPARHSSNPVRRNQVTRRWWSRSGALGKRRASFRPELEKVENRCPLSGYKIADNGTLFPRAINNLGQVVGIQNTGVGSGAFLTDSHGVTTTFAPGGAAFDLNNPNGAAKVKVIGQTNDGSLFLWDQSTGVRETSISVSCNFALADGSVKFLKDTIDTWPFDQGTGLPLGVTGDPETPYNLAPGRRFGVYQAL